MKRVDVIDELEERYDGILPVEAVDSLANKWWRRIQYNCCAEWTGNICAFLDYSAKMGYQNGLLLLRADTSRPYGPGNLYFGENTGDPPPWGKQGDLETPAERWNRCVYEFNRARVRAYRKREGTA